MAKQITLDAEVRQGLGKEKVKKMRKQGMIPSVFYGQGAANINLLIDNKSFITAVKKSEAKLNSLFNLKIKNGDKVQEEFVLLRQYQTNPLTDAFTHLDFMKVNVKEAINTKVQVRLIGEAPAVKLGLVLRQNLHELPIRCLPLEIPVSVDIDITKLVNAHDAVRIGDLKTDKFTIELPAEQQIVYAEVPREIKIEEAAPVDQSAEVPTTVQGQAEAAEGEAKPDAKGGAKPEAKAEAKPGDAKAAPAAGAKAAPAAKAGDKK